MRCYVASGGAFGHGARDPIQHVAAQRMTFGQGRMVEVGGLVMMHAEPFHDATHEA